LSVSASNIQDAFVLNVNTKEELVFVRIKEAMAPCPSSLLNAEKPESLPKLLI
jgi:hypothetical protein